MFYLPSLRRGRSVTLLRTVQTKGTVMYASMNNGPRAIRSKGRTLIIPTEGSRTVTSTLIGLVRSRSLQGGVKRSTHREFLEGFARSVVGGGLYRMLGGTAVGRGGV